LKNNIVVISVPFARIGRYSLSKLVLSILRERGDVVIVSPWSHKVKFRENFNGDNTFFIKWESIKISKFKQKILVVSELMRLLGYLRRFKNQGLMWFFRNHFSVFTEDGQDSRLGLFKSIAHFILSVLGRRRSSWKTVERLSGFEWYQFPELIKLVAAYADVTLIQSASWGMQDKALAKLSSMEGWRNVLLPYSTDQLHCNGYLFNDYHAVCVQGDLELDRARNFHLIPEQSIYRLGSIWFRHLAQLNKMINDIQTDKCNSRVIFYAGMGSLYFARKSEFAGLDALIQFVIDSDEKFRLIYRPVFCDEEDRNYIENKYGTLEGLEIQWPQASVIGIHDPLTINQEQSLLEYTRDIKGCDLLVMSLNSTICMDIAFLEKCGIISNMIDLDGRLERRHHSIAVRVCPAGVDVNTTDSLIESVKYFLDNSEKGEKTSAEMLSKWDYPEADFRSILISDVYGA